MNRTAIAWPAGSIRPYESLWAIFNRFWLLNRPSLSNFAKDFLVDGYNIGFSVPSLIYGVRLRSRDHVQLLRKESLTEILNVPLEELRFATAESLRNSVLEHVEPTLRYCPRCLARGYHSVVFQLISLRTCPMHGLPLQNRCQTCKAPISADLTSKAVRNPFRCLNCQTLLIRSQKEALCWKPIAGIRKTMKPIVDLYCSLLQYTVVFPEYLQVRCTPELAKAIVGSLARTLNVVIPPILCPRSMHRLPCRTNRVQSGAVLVLRRNRLNDKMSPYPDSRVSRSVTIAKAYRRYLEKKHLGRYKWVMRTRCRNADWLDRITAFNRTVAIKAYALHIWSDVAMFTMRPYGLDGRKLPWHENENLTLRARDIGIFMSRDWHHFMELSDTEHFWIWDHVSALEIMSLFEEALFLAKHAVPAGLFVQGRTIFSGQTLPCCLPVRNPITQNPELLSWKIGSPRRDERVIRERVKRLCVTEREHRRLLNWLRTKNRMEEAWCLERNHIP